MLIERDETLEQLKDALADQYTVQRELGRGGMAKVYLAEEHSPRRQVAIKVMNPDIANERIRARFLREIDLASKLSHPHIVPVFSAGEADGLLYYVMPYVQGESLRAVLDREERLEPDHALRIAYEVAEALNYAHQRGIVHRDVKPENVLLSDGHAVVLDFGVARGVAGTDAPNLTRTGMPVGTPAYMSPEQWAGSPVDSRSDVFSLGCVLYEMVFGIPPQGPPGERRNNVVRTLRRSGSNPYQTTINDVVGRCLEPDPDDRYADVSELVEQLSAVGGHGVTVRSRPTLPVAIAGLMIIVLAAIGVRALTTGLAADSDRDVRVAVAVLENQTGNAELDPLGVMAADWITQGLTRTGLVEVVGTRNALAMQGAEGDRVEALAEATGANMVISGRYYGVSENAQFAIQLSDLRNERSFLALDPVNVDLNSPLGAVEEIRQRVMGALATQLDPRFRPWTAAGVNPPSYDSYRAFLEGQQAFLRMDIGAALPAYYRAAELDTTFAGPLLAAAFAAVAADMWPLADSLSNVVERSRNRLDQASLHLLDWIRGLIDGRTEEAYSSIQRAAEMVQGPELHIFTAHTAFWLNRPVEAYRILSRVERDNPIVSVSYPYWDVVLQVLHLLGRHRQELTDARTARRLFADVDLSAVALVRAYAALGRSANIDSLIASGARSGFGRMNVVRQGDLLRTAALELRVHGFESLADEFSNREIGWYDERVSRGDVGEDVVYGYARSLYMAGRYEAAEPIFHRLYEANSDSVAYLGYAAASAARLGDRERALALADSLDSMTRRFLFGHREYWKARISSVLGNREEAVEYLRDAYAAGRLFRINAHTDVDLRELRGYPPYERLMAARD